MLLFADALYAPVLLADLRMSSWWPYLAGSPWTFSPLRSRIGPILNTII